MIADVLSLLEHQFRNGNVQVRKDFATEALIVPSVEHKLQQIFLNLFINARDAMPKGGWLSIATRVEGGQAVIEVADTGAGIQPDHLAAHLRPVLHHQADRTGHGARPVHHLRHRPRERRRHHLRERGGQGHAVPAALPAGAGRRFARGRWAATRPTTGHLKQAGS